MKPHPELDAEQVLTTVWADGRPLDQIALPVDPFAIADRLGLVTYVANLDDSLSGMLVKQIGRDPEVYVQADDSPNRQRFTCAHELGHYVLRSGQDDSEWTYVDRRDVLASQGTDADEIYANRFAASLLMPRRLVDRMCREFEAERNVYPTGTVVTASGRLTDARTVTLAYRFGVSADAMHYRLTNLGLHR